MIKKYPKVSIISPSSNTSCNFKALGKAWEKAIPAPLGKQTESLIQGIGLLAKYSPSRLHKLALPGQPFDSHLLELSALYRRSRQLFYQGSGKFTPSLVSSPRTLSSASLLENSIEYSPIANEYLWAATDRLEKKNTAHILAIRTYASSLFHEQNHRILWGLLPSAPSDPKKLSRYLNFIESLVITADMALGDQLGSTFASLFHLTGVTYDPGTTVKSDTKSKREYRNYLQAALHATYLNLELYDPLEIPKAIQALFPNLGELALRAAKRSAQLDREFVHRTNPVWQKKHRAMVLKSLCRPGEAALELSDDPMNQHTQYLWTEKWLELLGL